MSAKESLIRVRLNSEILEEFNTSKVIRERSHYSSVLPDVYDKHPELRYAEFSDVDVFSGFGGQMVMVLYFYNDDYEEE